jgi:raffinose/stachyose/melibiose transport system permease protein
MKKMFSKLGLTALFGVLTLIYLYPLFLVIINSIKPYSETMLNVIALPKKPTLDNYVKAIQVMNYPHLFMNTLIVTAIGVGGIIIISSLAGYMLSRTKTRLSWFGFIICIAPMMIPFQSYMIALIKISKNLHLINSIWGLGIVYWGIGAPLAIFMYHGFVKSIPKELEESAIMDGCSRLRTFISIIFPLMKPITITIVVINAMWMWNDFLLPLLMLGSEQNMKTLQLAAYGFFGQYKVEWNLAMAGVILTVVPAIVLYIFLQKYILKGMVSGAVKG